MDMRYYIFKKSPNEEGYTFECEGKERLYPIKVNFTQSSNENIAEILYGVSDVITGSVDREIVVKSNDANIIINTVFLILCDFLTSNPNKLVRFSGETESRTRLFTMWVSQNLEMIQRSLVVYGYTERKLWGVYQKNKQYNSLAFKLKILNSINYG